MLSRPEQVLLRFRPSPCIVRTVGGGPILLYVEFGSGNGAAASFFSRVVGGTQ